jgi:hypothetical protein
MVRKSHLAAAIGSAILALVPGVASAGAQDPPVPDLQIVSVTANVKHARVGQLITWTITARNNGPGLASLDAVEDPWQLYGDAGPYPRADFTLVDETCSLGISADTPGCEWTLVPPGTYTVTAVMTVNGSAPRMASNTACVFNLDGPPDANPANDCVTTSLKIVGRRVR